MYSIAKRISEVTSFWSQNAPIESKGGGVNCYHPVRRCITWSIWRLPWLQLQVLSPPSHSTACFYDTCSALKKTRITFNHEINFELSWFKAIVHGLLYYCSIEGHAIVLNRWNFRLAYLVFYHNFDLGEEKSPMLLHYGIVQLTWLKILRHIVQTAP